MIIIMMILSLNGYDCNNNATTISPAPEPESLQNIQALWKSAIPLSSPGKLRNKLSNHHDHHHHDHHHDYQKSLPVQDLVQRIPFQNPGWETGHTQQSQPLPSIIIVIIIIIYGSSWSSLLLSSLHDYWWWRQSSKLQYTTSKPVWQRCGELLVLRGDFYLCPLHLLLRLLHHQHHPLAGKVCLQEDISQIFPPLLDSQMQYHQTPGQYLAFLFFVLVHSQPSCISLGKTSH